MFKYNFELQFFIFHSYFQVRVFKVLKIARRPDFHYHQNDDLYMFMTKTKTDTHTLTFIPSPADAPHNHHHHCICWSSPNQQQTFEDRENINKQLTALFTTFQRVKRWVTFNPKNVDTNNAFFWLIRIETMEIPILSENPSIVRWLKYQLRLLDHLTAFLAAQLAY